MPPLVTVVIPAHNRPVWLERAVRSVLQQTDVSFELIVADDHSTEELITVRDLVHQHGHRFISPPPDSEGPDGPAATRNRGARAGSAPWLAFLDSDDYWLPGKLACQTAYHQSHPHHPLSQTAEHWIRDGKAVAQLTRYQHPPGDIFSHCLQRCCISCSSVMLSRELFDQAGGFDTRYAVCEDYELWLRLSHQHQVGWIPEPFTVKHAGHADQLSKAIPAMDRFRVRALLDLWINQPALRSTIAPHIVAKASTLEKGARKRQKRSTGLYERLQREFAHPLEHTTRRRAEELRAELERHLAINA